jgi:hypothetical protein
MIMAAGSMAAAAATVRSLQPQVCTVTCQRNTKLSARVIIHALLMSVTGWLRSGVTLIIYWARC